MMVVSCKIESTCVKSILCHLIAIQQKNQNLILDDIQSILHDSLVIFLDVNIEIIKNLILDDIKSIQRM